LPGEPKRLGGRDIADDDGHRVVGAVVCPVVLVEGVPRYVFDVAPPADHRPAVGMSLDGRGHDILEQEPPRAVLAALRLAPDARHPRVEAGLVDPAVQHPVGLVAHRELEPIGGDRRVVVRPVVVGARVEGCAIEEESSGDLAESQLLRALEEHVFEEVGHPGDPGVLVARADAVPDAEADDRSVPDFLHEDGEAVRQDGFLDTGGDRGGRGGGGRGSRSATGGEQSEHGDQGGEPHHPAAGRSEARRDHLISIVPRARARSPASTEEGAAGTVRKSVISCPDRRAARPASLETPSHEDREPMSTQEKARPAPTLGLTPDEITVRYSALQSKLVPLWKSIASLNRDPQTIVVVPSITLDQMNMAPSVLQAMEERFLFMLFLLRQPNARMVYVTSRPILPDVVDYY